MVNFQLKRHYGHDIPFNGLSFASQRLNSMLQWHILLPALFSSLTSPKKVFLTRRLTEG